MEECSGEYDEYTYRPTRIEVDSSVRTDTDWSSMNLCKPILKALREMGYDNPTKIQRDVIPYGLNGQDILARAHTGSGKTAAFLIPCLNRLAISPMIRKRHLLYTGGKKIITNFGECITKVLILLPTRELAAQCYGVCEELGKYLPISMCKLSGGSSLEDQEHKIRSCPDIIICTPGRCLDILLNTQNVHLDLLDILVFDEADKLIDLGFKDVCTSIVSRCSPRRQTMMFSATLASGELASLCLNGRPMIFGEQHSSGNAGGASTTSLSGSAGGSGKSSENFLPENLKFKFIGISHESKRLPALAKIIKEHVEKEKKENSRILVFFNMKRVCHTSAVVLQSLPFIPPLNEIHGNLSHQQRVKAIKQFHENEVTLLMASDIIARGIDLENIDLIINAEMPIDASEGAKSVLKNNDLPDWLVKFIHRAGRTGRAGRQGSVISLYDEVKEKKTIKNCQKYIRAQKRDYESITFTDAELEEFEIENAKQIIKTQLALDQVEKNIRKAEGKVKALRREEESEDPLASLTEKREWTIRKKNSLLKKAQKQISKQKISLNKDSHKSSSAGPSRSMRKEGAQKTSHGKTSPARSTRPQQRTSSGKRQSKTRR